MARTALLVVLAAALATLVRGDNESRYATIIASTSEGQQLLGGIAYYSRFGNNTAVTGRLVASFASTSRRRDIRLIDACSYFAPSEPIEGNWIALVSRGSCKFVTKASWAARAGASGVIVVDNTVSNQPPPIMAGPTDDEPAAATIPSVAITFNAGRFLIESYLERNIATFLTIKDGGAVAEESETTLSNTWFLGHIIIFAGTILLVSVVVLSTYYCRSRVERVEHVQERRDTQDLLKRMPTRRFSSLLELGPSPAPEEFPTCAVCLDDFEDGAELRVLPCNHEFHQSCVDPWLEEHHTCPLCKGDILTVADEDAAEEDSRLVIPQHRRRTTEPDLAPIAEAAEADLGDVSPTIVETDTDVDVEPLQFLGTEAHYEPTMAAPAMRQHSRLLDEDVTEYLSVLGADPRASPTLV